MGQKRQPKRTGMPIAPPVAKSAAPAPPSGNAAAPSGQEASLRAERDTAIERVAELEAALAAQENLAIARMAAMNAEQAQLEARFAALQRTSALHAATLQHSINLLSASLTAMQSSTIWRITRPIRAFVELARPPLRWRALAIGPPQKEIGFCRAALTDPAGQTPRGWVQLDLKTSSGAPIDASCMLRVECTDGRVLAFEIGGGAIGPHLIRLPDTASALGVETQTGALEEADPIEARVRCLGRAFALIDIIQKRPIDGYRALRIALRGQFSAALQALVTPHVPQRLADYERWTRAFDTPSADDLDRLRARATAMVDPPRFSIITPVYNTPSHYLREMIQSVRAQAYPHWELCLADDASPDPETRKILKQSAAQDDRIKIIYRETNGNISRASNSALALATGSHLALLDHDDVLPPHALATAAQEILNAPRSDIFYSDEDKIDDQGRRFDPYFKPDWNEELIYAQNYANHLTLYRADPVRALGGFRVGFEGSQDYDLLLRVLQQTREKIVHIPHILYHWRIFQGAANFSLTNMRAATLAARQAIKEKFLADGTPVEVVDGFADYHRLKRPHPSIWPKVSVIIPTRDHASLLKACLDGLFYDTDYPDLEIIVVDNSSKDAETFAYFRIIEQRGVRILPAPGPFNYSRLNNLAAREAHGEILLLLNNDISMISPDWLKEMIIHAVRPEVGAVGARLLYPDGGVQHGGVVLGIGGVAGHLHLGAAVDEPGYFARLKLAQEISCVTAACLATPKRVFDAVGGLDEHNLAVAFNDVDYCVRVRAAGHKIIWTPHAELTHWESKSRGSDDVPEKRARFEREVHYMRERWGPVLDADPYYNPNIDLYSNVPRPAFPPRIARPWA